jgi:Berberine and berberine like
MSGRRYVNNLSADDGHMVRDIWGINYERLIRIKRRYDPTTSSGSIATSIQQGRRRLLLPRGP